MEGTLLIVRLTADNKSLLERVAEDVFDAAIDARHVEAFLSEPGHCMMLALHDGCVVGQAVGIVNRRVDAPAELCIDNLGVAPAWQRKGIAVRLIEGLHGFARLSGCRAVWVGTEPDNEAARALYARLAAGGGKPAEDFVLYDWPVPEPAGDVSA